MGAGIAYKISFTLDNQDTSIMLDTINDVSVASSSRLTRHPIVNGDIIADHMYKEAITVRLNGSFSLNGGTLVNINTSGSTLSNIQKLFERLKNEGIICTLMKITTDATQNLRFLQRANMVLSDISWTEKINSMNFDFTFTQVLTNTGAVISQNSMNLTEFEDGEEYSVENIGNGTPAGTEIVQDLSDDIPSTGGGGVSSEYNAPGAGLTSSTLSQTSISLTNANIENLMKDILRKLAIRGYVTTKFIEKMRSYSQAALVNYILNVNRSKGITNTEATILYNVIHDTVLTLVDSSSNAVWTYSTFTNIITLGTTFESLRDSFLGFMYDTYKSCYKYLNGIRVYQSSKAGIQKFELTIDSKSYLFVLTKNNINNTFNLDMHEIIGSSYPLRKSAQNLGSSNEWSLLDTSVSPFYKFTYDNLYIRNQQNFGAGIQLVLSGYKINELQTVIKNNYTTIIEKLG